MVLNQKIKPFCCRPCSSFVIDVIVLLILWRNKLRKRKTRLIIDLTVGHLDGNRRVIK